MRTKMIKMLAISLLPLAFAWGAVSAADVPNQPAQQTAPAQSYQPNAGDFKVVLSDGNLVNGATSVVIMLDTPYGQIKIPSDSLVSAQFDTQNNMADIQLTDAEMKLKYNPATSEVKATTSAGTLTLTLAKVTRVGRAAVQIIGGSSPPAAQAQQSPPVASTQPAPVVVPPTVIYPPQQEQPYTYAYPYATVPPDYYYPPYYYQPYYDYGPYVGWPYFGFSIGVGPRFHHGFGFHGGFGGFGGFHGGHHH